MNFKNIDLNRFSEILGINKRIVILSHKSPDGDSIGSSIAMYHFLSQLGHQCSLITPDRAPDFLMWLDGADKLKSYEYHTKEVRNDIYHAEWIFCLDFNAENRVGDLTELLTNAPARKFNIDHHQEPQHFADYEYIETDASSTAQLVYELIVQTKHADLMNKSIAEALYVGIMTDTGSFRFSSTTASTHRVIAALIEAGAENSLIHQKVFDSSTEERLRLLGYSISKKMRIFPENGFAVIALSEAELNEFNYQKGDTEGIVNYPLSIQAVLVSVFISAKDDKVKMSFRSKGNIAVNGIANKYFDGGGHINAAGGISDLPLIETEEKVIEILKTELANVTS